MNPKMSSNNFGQTTPDRYILAIGFDPLDRTRLESALTEAGFDLAWAHGGENVLWLVRQQKPDLVILDLALLGGKGWEVCHRLSRDEGPPFLVLDDCSQEGNCLRALELGADDYLPRPFNPRELVARMKAILRRTAPKHSSQTPDSLRYPGLCLGARTCQVQVGDQEVHLTSREFDLLWQLARSPNRVFTREELLDAVWHDEGDRSLHTVDSTIKRLRQKIQPLHPQPWQIKTVRGRGYQFHLEG